MSKYVLIGSIIAAAISLSIAALIPAKGETSDPDNGIKINVSSDEEIISLLFS